jgi:signal transduction histidine kinase
MRRAPLERLTIRAALMIGFGLVLGLWLFTGYTFSGRMVSMEREASDVTSRYMAAQDLLSTVRQQVSTNSIVLRNALLDPSPAAQPSYTVRLEQGFKAIDDALDDYKPVFESPTEPPAITRLRSETMEFKRLTFAVLSARQEAGGTSASWDLLNEHITPRRATVLALSEEIRALNRKGLVEHQTATAAIHRTAELQWWRRLGFALASTIGIALLAILYAGRLEDRLRKQRDIDVQHRRDLQFLSARLVAAQEEERRTISRELHDEVGQVLGAIKVEAELAGRTIDAQGNARQALSEIQSLTDSAMATVRDLSQLLRPAVLDDLGLGAAIEWLLRGVERRSRLAVALTQRGRVERLVPETETAAFRIVQEALSNVVRHADASRCDVVLDYRPGSLVMSIKDDGRGFDSSVVQAPGERRSLGLIGIRERVADCGGTIAIDSAPGRGTTLLVELPARTLPQPTDVEEPEGRAMHDALPSPGALHG